MDNINGQTLEFWFRTLRVTGEDDHGVYVSLGDSDTVGLLRGNKVHLQIEEGTNEHPAKYEGYTPVRYAGPAGMESR
jgi:hypothetical protein